MHSAQYKPIPSTDDVNPASDSNACLFCGASTSKEDKKCSKCGKEIKSFLEGAAPVEFLVDTNNRGDSTMQFSAQLFDKGVNPEAIKKLEDELKKNKVQDNVVRNISDQLKKVFPTTQPTSGPSNPSTPTAQQPQEATVASIMDKIGQELPLDDSTIDILVITTPKEDDLIDSEDDLPIELHELPEMEDEELEEEQEDNNIVEEPKSDVVDTKEELEDAEDPESEAKAIGEELGIDWDDVDFTPSDLLAGIQVEFEHGSDNPELNVTDDKILDTAKIALAHLKELADYYKKLKKIEKSSAREDFNVQIVDSKGNVIHDEFCSRQDLQMCFDKCWKLMPEYTEDPNADVVVNDLKSQRKQFLDIHPSLSDQ
jgi:hypothetical protein